MLLFLLLLSLLLSPLTAALRWGAVLPTRPSSSADPRHRGAFDKSLLAGEENDDPWQRERHRCNHHQGPFDAEPRAEGVQLGGRSVDGFGLFASAWM